MHYRINSRLKVLGKNTDDLIPILRERGINVTAAEIKTALSGESQSPKAQDIVSYSNEIVTAWEIETEG